MKLHRLTAAGLLATALAAGLAGCNNGNHDKWVDNGNQRWATVKSGIAMQMAQQQFAAGQLGLAKKTIGDAARADEKNPQLWLMAGRISLENSELELGYQQLKKSIEFGEELEGYSLEEKAKPYYYQGIIDQRWQKYESARERYSQAYERDLDNPAYFMAMIEMMVQINELDQAIVQLEEKAGYFDQNASVRALLGHVYRRQGNHEKAELWFRQASMLAPEDMKLREELARAQVSTGHYAEAARTIGEVLRSDYAEGRPDLYRLQGEAYVKAGKLREARDVYTKLTAMDRNSVEDWAKLGELAYQVGDEAAALQAANRLINLSPEDHRGYLLAGMVWNKRDRLDRALSMFDRASELAPNNTTPLILRGIALQKNDRPAAAAEAYSQALKINPADNRAQRLLASVNEQLH